MARLFQNWPNKAFYKKLQQEPSTSVQGNENHENKISASSDLIYYSIPIKTFLFTKIYKEFKKCVKEK